MATSSASAIVIVAIRECRLAIRNHASVRTQCCAASQDSHWAASGKSRTSTLCGFGEREDFEVVRVVHDAQHVAERVDHGGGDEPRGPAWRDRLVLLGAHRQQSLNRGVDVVDVPVHDGAARLGRGAGRCVAAVDDAQLGLVVADAELGVGQASVGARAPEVGLHTQELRVPRYGRRHVVGPEADRADSSQAYHASPSHPERTPWQAYARLSGCTPKPTSLWAKPRRRAVLASADVTHSRGGAQLSAGSVTVDIGRASVVAIVMAAVLLGGLAAGGVYAALDTQDMKVRVIGFSVAVL